MNNKTILIVTSSYPRYQNDTAGIFIHEFNKNLNQYCNIIVLAPFTNGLQKYENIDGIYIERHKQFPISKFGFGNSDFGMFESIKKNPFKLLFLFSFLYYQIKAIQKIIKDSKIDVIIYHWIIPNGISNIYMKYTSRKKLPSIIFARGSDYWGFNNYFINKLRFKILDSFDKIITVSNAMKTDMLKRDQSLDIITIPTGINTDFFSTKNTNMTKSEKFSLLFVGKVCKAKGFDVLIESLEIIKKSIANFELNIIGQSVDNSMLNKLKTSSISINANLIGKVENQNIPNYYLKSDIFILPSLSEGWPNVVKEALSCGCICIVSKIPVFEEYIDKYEFLHVVEKNNPSELANKIINIYNNYDYYKKFKEDARKFAVENFDESLITKKIILEIENLLNNDKN